MLRVDFHDASSTVIMRIEGRFVGAYAEDTQNLVKRNLPLKIVVDVTEVTFVDQVGEEVLSWFARVGAKFLADSSYSRDICGRLHLPKTAKRFPSSGQVTALAE